MTEKTITKAITEAKEFIKRANLVLRNDQLKYVEIGCGNKLSGALRRQSMELSNALSVLRGYVNRDRGNP
jgi:hypothetical protein